MANRSKNIFAYLDSDDEDTPKVSKKDITPPSAPVALNKPAAGNKKSGNKKNAAPVDSEKKERAPREAREGGDSREGGRGRGGRGARGGRRDFERRSGTGRGRETSKHGGGSRNWGNDTDKTELAAEAEVQEGKVKTGDEEEVAEATPVVEEEEEEVQFSYDEYLAKKKEARVGVHFAEKQVREVVNEFTNAKIITKEGKTPDFMDSLYEKVHTKKSSGRKKQLITDLGFQPAAPEREPRFRDVAGGRGGRGRGRGGRGDGGRGRGAGRGNRNAVPNVGDLSAFPSL